jgi:hypothetical protein
LPIPPEFYPDSLSAPFITDIRKAGIEEGYSPQPVITADDAEGMATEDLYRSGIRRRPDPVNIAGAAAQARARSQQIRERIAGRSENPSQIAKFQNESGGMSLADAISQATGPSINRPMINDAVRQYDAQGFAPDFARVPTQSEMGDLSERGRFYREQEALRDRFASRPQDVGISGMYEEGRAPLLVGPQPQGQRDFKGDGYTATITPRADGGFSTVVRGNEPVTEGQRQRQLQGQVDRLRRQRAAAGQTMTPMEQRAARQAQVTQARRGRLGLGPVVGRMIRQAPQRQQQQKPPGKRLHDGFYAVQERRAFQEEMQEDITKQFKNIESDYTYESAVDLALKLQKFALDGFVTPAFAEYVSDKIRALNVRNGKPAGGPYGGPPIQAGGKPEPQYEIPSYPFLAEPEGESAPSQTGRSRSGIISGRS